MASFKEVRPKTFMVRWRERTPHGWRERSKLMPEGSGRKFAEEWNREREKQALIGTRGDFWTKGTQTFGDFTVDWFERKAPSLAPRTRRDYSITLNRFLVPAFGHVPLRQIDVAAVEDFRDSALRDGAGKRQLQMALGLLSQILDRAQAREEIRVNPCRLVQGVKQEQKQPVKPLSPETVEGIRAWLLTNRTHRDATLVSVLAYAGLRPGEALALHWHHIDGSRLHVEGAVALGELGPTKTTHNRTVDLLPSLRADLNEFRLAQGRPEGLVFRGREKGLWTPTMYANWWRRAWIPAVTKERKAGDETPPGLDLKPRPRPYDLRHSFASLLIAQGLNVFEVADQLGHSPDMTHRVYGHTYEEFEAGERISAEERIRQARDQRKAAES